MQVSGASCLRCETDIDVVQRQGDTDLKNASQFPRSRLSQARSIDAMLAQMGSIVALVLYEGRSMTIITSEYF